MKANQTWIDGGRGIKDATRLVVCNILAWVGLTALLVAGFLLAALCSGTGCSHIPTLPDLPSITNAIPGTPTTTTTTTTTTVPPAVGAYTITKVTASMIYWKGPDLTWPEKDGCCGEARLNGKKFDHIRRNTKSRDWKNVHNGYQGWIEPADKAPCTLTLESYDGKQSVKVGDFQWVR
jgi:hypothetical protein